MNGAAQQAFITHDAFKCAYCTPGQICPAVGMLREVEAGWPNRAGHSARCSMIPYAFVMLWRLKKCPQWTAGFDVSGERHCRSASEREKL